MSAPPQAYDTRCAEVLRDRDHAEGYVASVCFKTGPPLRLGVELEWTVHDCREPGRPVSPARLTRALGAHAPRTLAPDSPHRPLARGGVVTVEPGGQVEISTPPGTSLSGLLAAADQDLGYLVEVLADAGLVLGGTGTDAHRPPRRMLDTPRYAAMQTAFDRAGPEGHTMMCATAGLQVCLDAGEPDRVATRFAALQALGPVLLATFANSPRLGGCDTGWASTRMRNWYAVDATRSAAVPVDDHPAAAWARYALDATLLCVRRPDRDWTAPPGVTFADWLAGALPTPPTLDDLEYHLGTLFPPVRPRGYLEVRYLDAQPVAEWSAPVAVLAAIFATEETVDAALAFAAPAADRWLAAARHGPADPVIARAASRVLDLACTALDDTDLTPRQRATVIRAVEWRRRRLREEP